MTKTAVLPGIEISFLQAILEEIAEYIPGCTCHEAYTSRGLVAPDCLYHSSGMEEIEELVKAGLERRPPDSSIVEPHRRVTLAAIEGRAVPILLVNDMDPVVLRGEDPR